MNKPSQVYQIKISLLDTEPLIWRRVQVPDHYDLSNLHRAIQSAMGWENSHLYEFVRCTRESIPETYKVKEVLSLKNDKVYYEYDFGDGWVHEISLEKILPASAGIKYPICIAGEMACPPEDCGGIPGYYNLLEIIKNPKHREYSFTLDWLGKKFDPNRFDPKKVYFNKN
jgi:hypothetical protein